MPRRVEPSTKRRRATSLAFGLDLLSDHWLSGGHIAADPILRQSITFDNDTAFARHTLLREALEMATWFCDAYASWQKGGIENANGRLRRWLPRQTNIDNLADEDL